MGGERLVALAGPGYGPWGLQGNGPTGTGTQVPAITMDEVLHDYQLDTVDLLKVDIEGSEKELFDAAERRAEVSEAPQSVIDALANTVKCAALTSRTAFSPLSSDYVVN